MKTSTIFKSLFFVSVLFLFSNNIFSQSEDTRSNVIRYENLLNSKETLRFEVINDYGILVKFIEFKDGILSTYTSNNQLYGQYSVKHDQKNNKLVLTPKENKEKQLQEDQSFDLTYEGLAENKYHTFLAKNEKFSFTYILKLEK